MAFALRRVRREDADDIVAETFLVAWRRFEHFPSEPLPWLFGIARNVIATRRRGDRRRAALFARLHDDSDRTQPGHPSTERLEIAKAFNSLSDRDRDALMLIAWDGLTIPQAAEVVGCSPASFSLRLHRARRRLARRMEVDPSLPLLSPHPAPSREDTR